MLGGGTGPEQAELADLHSGPQLDGQGSDVREFQRHVAGEAGVDPARGGVREQPQAAKGALALQASRDVIRQRHHLVGGRQHELPRMQDERVVSRRLHQPRKVGLLDGRVDVRIAVILEDPEVPVHPHVDAGGLDQLRAVRVELHAPGLDLFPDVAIGEQHARNLSGPVRCLGEHRFGCQPQGLTRPASGLRGCSQWNGASQADSASSILVTRSIGGPAHGLLLVHRSALAGHSSFLPANKASG